MKLEYGMLPDDALSETLTLTPIQRFYLRSLIKGYRRMVACNDYTAEQSRLQYIAGYLHGTGHHMTRVGRALAVARVYRYGRSA